MCAFMGGQGSRARSIAWTEDATPPLKAVPSGSNTVPTIVFKERAGCPGGGKGIPCGDKPFTLSTMTDQAVCYGIRTAQTSANGIGVSEELSHTLDAAGSVDSVAYSVDCRNMNLTKEHGTLQAKENGGQSLNYMGAVCYAYDQYNGAISEKQATLGVNCGISTGRNGVCYPINSHQQDSRYQTPRGRKYIIRRLTPLECCRLQGFPDWWEDGVEGSDSARYRMWGNGIALPNAVHVIGCAAKLLREVSCNR